MYDNILPLIGRTKPLFTEDLSKSEAEINDIIKKSHPGDRWSRYYRECHLP